MAPSRSIAEGALHRAGQLETALVAHSAVEQAAVAWWTEADGVAQFAGYVVPAQPRAVHTTGTSLETDHVRRWEHLWAMLYQQGDPDEAEFDIRGWRSSYTRKLLPDEQMRDWIDQTVRSIIQLQPRSVLEIGCGSGLLLHRIAPFCTHYLAVDSSAAAVERLTRQVDERGLSHIVELRTAAAPDLGSLPYKFDVVVLNSVVQYFPTADYLTGVLELAAAHTRDGGTVFIGDVYSLPLREALHTSIVLHQAAACAPRELLRARVLHRIANQTELLIHPGFFTAFAARSPRISAVEARPKYGRYSNEMTDFRYDVLLEISPASGTEISVPWHDWRDDHLDSDMLRAMISKASPPGFGVTNIPNARVAGWMDSWAAINASNGLDLMAGLTGGDGLTADDLRDLSAGTAYEISVSCLSAHPDGSLDAVWLPRGAPRARTVLPHRRQSVSHQVNDPLWARATEGLVWDLRQHLRQELGQSASSATLICVEELPFLSRSSETSKSSSDIRLSAVGRGTV